MQGLDDLRLGCRVAGREGIESSPPVAEPGPGSSETQKVQSAATAAHRAREAHNGGPCPHTPPRAEGVEREGPPRRRSGSGEFEFRRPALL